MAKPSLVLLEAQPSPYSKPSDLCSLAEGCQTVLCAERISEHAGWLRAILLTITSPSAFQCLDVALPSQRQLILLSIEIKWLSHWFREEL